MSKRVSFLIVLQLLLSNTSKADLSSFQNSLKASETKISSSEDLLNKLESNQKSLQDYIQKNCNVLDKSKSENDPACKDSVPISQYMTSYTALSNSIGESNKALEETKKERQKIVSDAKTKLNPSEMLTFLNGSNQLNDQEIRKLKVEFSAKVSKMEVDQAKKDIQNSDQYKLMVKGITTTLNSNLFCIAKNRCPSTGPGGVLYERDIDSLLSRSTSSMAVEKAKGGASNK